MTPRASSAKVLSLFGLILSIIVATTAFLVDAHPGSAVTPTTVTMYPAGTVPVTVAEWDNHAVELGVRFTVSTPGKIMGVRFYKSGRNTGTHLGRLWTSTGALLASATFTNETSSGWQTVTFATPVSVSANITYVASYHTTAGFYSENQGAFNSGATIGNSTIRGTAGTYVYGTGGFPTSTWHNSAYYVDAVFSPSVVSTSSSAPTSSAPTTSAPAPVTSSASSPAPAPVTSTSSSVAPAPVSSSASSPAPAPVTSTSSSVAPAPTTSAATSSQPAPVTSSSSASSSSSWPDATNTGVPAGTTLTSVPGQLTSGPGWTWNSAGYVQVNAPNTTLHALDIHGSVHNSYDGLVLTDDRVRCTNEANWCVTLGDHSSITDTEIGGQENGTTFGQAVGVWTGDSNAGNVIERVNIHDTMHGMRLDGGTTVADSYLHDFPMGDAPYQTAHTDGIFVSTGQNIVIKHNSFESSNNSQIFVQDYGNTAEGVGNMLVQDNSFTNVTRNGENSAYGVGIENKDITGPISVVGNVFNRGWTVLPIEIPSTGSYSGNVYTDGTAAGVRIV